MFLNFSNNSYRNLDINLYTCGIESCISKHSYGPALRSGYMIHYILKGHGIFKVNDKTYHLGENEAFLIEPNVLIYYEADENDPWEYCWIGFNGVKTKEYLSRTKLSIDNPIFSFDEDKKLWNCMNSIITSSKMTLNKDLLLISKLYKFLYLLCEIYPNNEINNTQNQQKYIEDALMFIEQNYSDNITINEISKYISIDRSYLHRLFKKYINKSPQKFLLDLRMEKASSLLENSTLRISDIARSVGYKDALLFSKTFKKLKNCTPTEYRNGKNHTSGV